AIGMVPEIAHPDGVGAQAEAVEVRGDLGRGARAVEQGDRASTVLERLHPDLVLRRALPHEDPLYAERVLIYGDHFTVREDVEIGMVPEIAHPDGVGAQAEAVEVRGDLGRGARAVEQGDRASTVLERLHPDLVLRRALPHEDPLYAERVLIYGDHFTVREDV